MRNPKFRKVFANLRIIRAELDATIGAGVWAAICSQILELDTTEEQSAQRIQNTYRWIMSLHFR